MNSGRWNENSSNYIKDVALSMNVRATGPESTLILRELYNIKHYLSTTQNKDDPLEKIYGTVLYRENDSNVDYSLFKLILRDYVNLGIKRYLGLTIKEYLDLTPYEKMIYDEFALEYSELTAKEVEKLERENDNTIKRFNKNNSIDLDFLGDNDEF